jgi:hypothetical protein
MPSGPAKLAVFSKEEEYGRTDFRLVAEKPVLVPPQSRTRSSDAVVGIIGLFIVTVIFVLSVYFVARYLL